MYKKLNYIIIGVSLFVSSLYIGVEYLGATINSVRIDRTDIAFSIDFANNDGSSIAYDSSGQSRHANETGTITFNDEGIDMSGTDNNYLSANSTGVFNNPDISIVFQFTPDTAADFNDTYFIFDVTSPNQGYYIIHRNDASNNRLDIKLGTQAATQIPFTTYGKFWKINEKNILVITSSNGDTDIWLNGNKILDNDSTAWTRTSNPSGVNFGTQWNGAFSYDGGFNYFKVWKRKLKDSEAITISKDRHTNLQSNSTTDHSVKLDLGNNNGSSIFYETSGNQKHATSTGSVTYNNQGFDISGSTGSYVTFNGTGVFNSANQAFAIKFTPDFNWDENVTRFLFDVRDANQNYTILKRNDASNNTLDIRIAGGATIAISVATYASYWKANEENVLVYSGASGNNNLWLNGVKILNSNGTTWTADDPNLVVLGCQFAFNACFDGTINFFKVWDRQLTDQEAFAISNNRKVVINGPTRSLIAYWSMDQDTVNGDILYDNGGNGLSVTAVGFDTNNGVVTSTIGKVNTAVDFDGTNGYMTVPLGINPSLDSTATFSTSLWFKTTDTSATSSIFGYFDSVGIFQIAMNSGNMKVTVGQAGGTVNVVETPADVYNDGKWHNLVYTYDGAGNAKLYLDDSLKDTDGTSPSSFDSATTNANIGAVGDAANGNGFTKFTGEIDEVRIYNHLLNAADVANVNQSFKRTNIQ